MSDAPSGQFPASKRASSERKAGRLKNAAMLPNPRKNTMGRPTKYKPEYCELVETWGKQGKSKAEMCSLLNVGRATLHDWERDFPEFAACLSRAREHAQAWWEGKAQKSLGRKHFQAQLWRYSMAGRFKEDYADNGNGSASNGLDLSQLVGAISQGVAAATLEAGRPKDDAPSAAQDVVPAAVSFEKPRG